MTETSTGPLAALRPPDAYVDWCELPVRFSDQDLNRHVNNTAISQYVEEARVSLRLRQLSAKVLSDPVAYAVASFRIRYLKSIHYPGNVRVGTSVVRLGRTSYTLVHGIYAESVLSALARTVTVILDPERSGPMPIPEVMRAAMQRLVRDSAAIVSAADEI